MKKAKTRWWERKSSGKTFHNNYINLLKRSINDKIEFEKQYMGLVAMVRSRDFESNDDYKSLLSWYSTEHTKRTLKYPGDAVLIEKLKEYVHMGHSIEKSIELSYLYYKEYFRLYDYNKSTGLNISMQFLDEVKKKEVL